MFLSIRVARRFCCVSSSDCKAATPFVKGSSTFAALKVMSSPLNEGSVPF